MHRLFDISIESLSNVCVVSQIKGKYTNRYVDLSTFGPISKHLTMWTYKRLSI